MNDKCASEMVRTSYYAVYQQYFAPKFKAIDIMLKTMEEPLSVTETAHALQMTEESVTCVMTRESVAQLDKNGFLTVMSQGDSQLCGLYRRQLAYGMKTTYSPADIAYIYGLQEPTVRSIFKKMGIVKTRTSDVPHLLDQIPVFILT